MHPLISSKSFFNGGVSMKKSESDLPKEWIELVKEAMKSDITKEDFKIFLEKEKEKRKNQKF